MDWGGLTLHMCWEERREEAEEEGREEEEIKGIIWLNGILDNLSLHFIRKRGREAGVQSYHALCECRHAAETSKVPALSHSRPLWTSTYTFCTGSKVSD